MNPVVDCGFRNPSAWPVDPCNHQSVPNRPQLRFQTAASALVVGKSIHVTRDPHYLQARGCRRGPGARPISADRGDRVPVPGSVLSGAPLERIEHRSHLFFISVSGVYSRVLAEAASLPRRLTIAC